MTPGPRGNDNLIARRRLFSIAGAAGLSLALGACGKEDEPTPEPTPTPEETPTPEPKPTQGPITSPIAGYGDPQKWTGRTLTIAGWGGDYQSAQQEAFFDAFALATGISIQLKSADVLRLKEQVDQNAVTWDVMTFPMEEVISLAQAGYLEAIDYQIVDKTKLFPEIALQYGVGAAFFSTVLVYPPASSNAPQSWQDFWDVPAPVEGTEPDPGTLRALRHSPVGTLEFALLADGVEVDKLYPLDLERAFASLEKIRKNVAVWYEDGKQPVELVVAGQVGMASAWNVRPWQLGLTDEIRYLWYGGMLSADAWIVPKGAPNRDVAMDFINFSTRAVPSANFGRLIPYGPVNPDAFQLLDLDRAQILPSSAINRSVQFVQNWNWWADNLESVTARFTDWLLGKPEVEASPASD